jgi:hypothetical protein
MLAARPVYDSWLPQPVQGVSLSVSSQTENPMLLQGNRAANSMIDENRNLDTDISQAEWLDAGELHLRHRPISEAAQALVAAVVGQFPDSSTSRPKSLQRRHIALGALLADLLTLHHAGRIGSHSMNRTAFPMKMLGFGHDVFGTLKDQMVAAGFLIFQPGKPRWETLDTSFGQGGGQNVIKNTGGYVARFKLTEKMLDFVAAHGVDPADGRSHWQRPKKTADGAVPEIVINDAALVVLRDTGGREGARKIDPKDMVVDWGDLRVQAILSDLKALNGFLVPRVDGIGFPGLRRIFSGGDQPGFAWRTGGRFYTARLKGGDKPHEMMSGKKGGRLSGWTESP